MKKGSWLQECVGVCVNSECDVTLPTIPTGLCDAGTPACGSGEFLCRRGSCISAMWRCDGDNDCGDNSDEEGCGKACCGCLMWVLGGGVFGFTNNLPFWPAVPDCESNSFQCKRGSCINAMWRCDGENDCGDNSDEEGCGKARFVLLMSMTGKTTNCV